jgi:hypothetical protein
MNQLLILIPLNVDLQAFDEGWPTFLENAEQMPGLIRESVTHIDRCLYGQNFLQRIYSFYFPDQETLEEGLLSPAGEKAGRILHQISGGNVILLKGEIKEDSLDHIQSTSLS